MLELFTIGHSTHSIETFVDLLNKYQITALGDVRSQPYSKFNPQFQQNSLKHTLKACGVAYVFLGYELGPRSDDPLCYINGKVSYAVLAAAKKFRGGLDRIRNGMKTYRIALMCAEKDPLMCHRMILVCRYLRSDNIIIRHILETGDTEDNQAAEQRLLKLLKMPPIELFETSETQIERAYDRQSEKLAVALEIETKI